MVSHSTYKGMTRSLSCLTPRRLDIMFIACLCSIYQADPKESHLEVAKRIFGYLKGTPNLGLWYPKDSSFDFKGYSDTNYTGYRLDRKSTSEGCQMLG